MDVVIISIIASSATAIVSVICGIVVAKMNNRNQLNLKKMELYEEDKKHAFKDYLVAISKIKYKQYNEWKKEDYNNWRCDYSEKSLIIMLYINKDLREIIKDIDS